MRIMLISNMVASILVVVVVTTFKRTKVLNLNYAEDYGTYYGRVKVKGKLIPHTEHYWRVLCISLLPLRRLALD